MELVLFLVVNYSYRASIMTNYQASVYYSFHPKKRKEKRTGSKLIRKQSTFVSIIKSHTHTY